MSKSPQAGLNHAGLGAGWRSLRTRLLPLGIDGAQLVATGQPLAAPVPLEPATMPGQVGGDLIGGDGRHG